MVTARVWRTLTAIFLLAAVFGAFLGAAYAQAPLPVPALSGRVIDQTGTLDATQRQVLEAKLASFEQAKGSQIVVLMVPTTAPEDIASYANRVGATWKIGRKEVGDGVLVIVAKDDRKMRIEVAKALEGAVPDLAAARIIDNEMKPRFRNNDFAGGLGAATDQLIARINGEALPEVDSPNADKGLGGLLGDSDIDWGELGIFLFFGVIVVGRVLRSMLGNKLGPLVVGAGAGVIAMVVTSSIVLAVIAGFLALLFTLFSGAIALPSLGGGRGGGSWGGGASGDW
ncbi:MAG: YgcG family protein [Variovorax sp.]|nr:MAG: YgcG family protein [Variovorax sp.]